MSGTPASALDVDRPAGFDLRFGTTADALCVGVLATQVFLDTYATEGIRPDLASEALSLCSTAAVERAFAEPGRLFVLAEASAHLVAFAEISVARAEPVDRAVGTEVVRLYVQRRFARRGLGRALATAAERIAADAGQPFVWLTAWAGNHAALAFYRSIGFRDIGRTDHVFEGARFENRVLVKATRSALGCHAVS